MCNATDRGIGDHVTRRPETKEIGSGSPPELMSRLLRSDRLDLRELLRVFIRDSHPRRQ